MCIPESEWTKGQREFVGTTFTTDKGSVLTVTGVSGKDKSGKILFSVECSKCSEDKELFPAGSITSIKISLVGGKIPCGCSKKPNWTDQQDEVLMQRILDEKVSHLSVIGSEKVKGSHREFILECNTCSKDSELWPKGSITSVKGSLLTGQIPCGCSKKPNWTEVQFKIRVQRECDQRGYIFHGWSGKFKGQKTKLDLSNPITGNRWQSTNINRFFSQGNGDPEVKKQNQKLSGVGYGYYPHRTTEQDNLYVIRFKKDQIIKVGRGFCILDRVLDNGNNLLKQSSHDLSDIEILSIYKGTHQEIYDTEQAIHCELTDQGYHIPLEWTTESFDYDSEGMIQLLLKRSGLVEDVSKVKVVINNLANGAIKPEGRVNKKLIQSFVEDQPHKSCSNI